MGVPIGMDYSSFKTGVVLRNVLCEHCGKEYVYQLERSSEGKGSSFLFVDNQGAAERAEARAEESLRRKLEKGIDVVPCPVCGWYQKNMLPKAKKAYRYWMHVVGGVLLAVFLLGGFIGAIVNAGPSGSTPKIAWPIFLAVLISGTALALGLLLTQLILARRFDPNSQDVEYRKELGREKGMLRQEYETMLRLREEQQATLPEAGLER